jgi:Holliday junction resolvasome RuvABC endonuclease subunit
VVLLGDDLEIKSQNLIRINDQVKGAERLVNIEKGFDQIVSPYVAEDVECFVEGYAYGAKYQRESLAELGGVVRRYLFINKLNFWIIPPTSLKLFVTGTGKASKNYMKKCTKDNWGEIFKSDDVCDAYGLSRLGITIMKSLRGTEGYSHLEEHQQSVVKDILMNLEFYRNSNTAKRRRRNVTGKRKTQSQRHN